MKNTASSANIARLSALSLALSLSFTVSAATYSVTELSADELGVNAFAQTIDEQGNAAIIVQDNFNPPLNLSLLDFDSEGLASQLTDVDAARAGNPNLEDYTYLVGLTRSASRDNNPFVQQIALYQSYVVEQNLAPVRATAFDEEREATNGFTFSPDIYLNTMHSPEQFAGTSEAVFETIEYTNEQDQVVTYVLPEFERRAFATINGVTTPLMPSESTLGGISEANGMNANLQVVGQQTVAISNQFQELIDDCDDAEERGDQPLLACYRNISRNNALATTNFRQAVLWELDNSGMVVNTESFAYPFTFEREEEGIERLFFSNARDINNSGVAVGESLYANAEGDVSRFLGAAIFADGETTPFLVEDGQTPSAALAINDNNLVTGFYSQVVNGTVRTKFYVYDIDAEEATFPTDFFPGSSSLGRDINNNNIVVGEGEIESANTQSRRRHGFMYSLETQEFINLNDTLACNSPYTIVSAQAINDDNTIIANALVSRQARDVRGDLATDDNGEAIIVDMVIPVLLEPIAGGVNPECSVEETIIPERQGASLSLWGLLLLAFVGFRRFFK